jgi:hypothetical protein
MVSALEARIDELNERFEMPSDFVVPGQNRVSALLDVARTVVRRGERLVVTALAEVEDSQVGPYLNRLSDLLWTMARWQEGEHLLARVGATSKGRRNKTAPANNDGAMAKHSKAATGVTKAVRTKAGRSKGRITTKKSPTTKTSAAIKKRVASKKSKGS